MPRHFFAGDQLWLAGADDPETSTPSVALAPGEPFSLWTDESGGISVSNQIVAADGVTPLNLDPVTGQPVADELGRRPHLYGPDTTGGVEIVLLWFDGGSGVRYPMFAVDLLKVLLESPPTARDVAQTWTAVQSFTAGIQVPDSSLSIATIQNLQNTLDTLAAAAANDGLDAEAVQDLMSTSLVAGPNITLVYNDTTGVITISGAAGSSSGIDAEAAQDLMASTIVAGSGMTVTYNDTAGTLTLSITDNTLSIAKTSGLQTALDARVRTDTAAQGLNSTQQLNARTNVDALGKSEGETIMYYTGTAWPAPPPGRAAWRSIGYPLAPAPHSLIGQRIGEPWDCDPAAT